MRTVVLGLALASTLLGLSGLSGCSDDDGSRKLPPDTAIDDKPPAITNQTHVRITFHALGAANRFTCQIDSAAANGCASPFEADVTDGDHTFQVSAAIDGTVDTTPATTTWKVDTVPPDTTIVTGPPALDNALDPAFTFQGSDHGGAVTFECALDGAAFAACSSPATVSISDGGHQYLVRAVDAAGNRDPSPAMLSWVVDSTAPDTMITAGPSAGSTTAANVTFQFGSPDSPVTLECSLDGAPFAGCTSPVSLTLADGAHTFAARARDEVGLVDPSPATVTWTVDATPPAVTITASPGNPSNSSTGTFLFSSPDATATFACRIDGGAFAACTPGFTTAALTDGSHTFTVRATDPVGNASTAAFTWAIDTIAPVVTVTPVATPTNDSTPSVAFTVTGATTIQCQVDAGSFATCTSPFTPAALGDGSHTVTVRGSDAAGNAGTGATTFTVDTVPPVVTVAPVATPTNDSTPSVAFTVTGATTIQCRVDAGSFATCTSPFTPAALGDGSHTVTVRGTDAAGNAGTGATTFTVDTTPPPVAFDDTPPAQWPVNYFDMKFHTTEGTATLSCSLNGAAFTPCTSPLTIATVYGVTSTFSVRATDTLGNSATVTTSWVSSDGLVLHYPWEQGSTHNTSLLAQNAAYSPDGTATLPVVGGWAGTAAGSPAAHKYPSTIRPLSSSASGTYTASIWVRVATSSNGGTLLSNLTPANGFLLTLSGRQVFLQVNENDKPFTASAAIPQNQWVQLGLLTTGQAKGLHLLVNGNIVGTAQPPVANGFGPGQAPDLTVGTIFGVDIDDLRFYNRALAGSEICTTLLRGQPNVDGVCVPLIPGIELDFENNQVRHTGNWGLTLVPPQELAFVPTPLGSGLRLLSSGSQFGYSTGFAANVSAAPGHSFSFWFVAGSSQIDTLIDFLHPCVPGAPFTCGIRVTHSTASGLNIVANAGAATPLSKTIAIPNGLHSVVVTEQKAAGNNNTLSLSIYVDGVLTVMPIGTGNVFANPSDAVVLARAQATTVDEYELWPRDLSLDPEMLCENGWDGEWNAITGVCLLTSN